MVPLVKRHDLLLDGLVFRPVGGVLSLGVCVLLLPAPVGQGSGSAHEADPSVTFDETQIAISREIESWVSSIKV